MRTILSEIRKCKLAHGNKVNSIEKKKNKLAVLEAQLDLLYGNPVWNFGRIDKIERACHALQDGGAW